MGGGKGRRKDPAENFRACGRKKGGVHLPNRVLTAQNGERRGLSPLLSLSFPSAAARKGKASFRAEGPRKKGLVVGRIVPRDRKEKKRKNPFAEAYEGDSEKLEGEKGKEKVSRQTRGKSSFLFPKPSTLVALPWKSVPGEQSRAPVGGGKGQTEISEKGKKEKRPEQED